jgi:hypothetical protein
MVRPSVRDVKTFAGVRTSSLRSASPAARCTASQGLRAHVAPVCDVKAYSNPLWKNTARRPRPLPDIEAIELVERFFEVGRVIVGTNHPIGIFLAGCRECLASWEVHAAHRSTAGVVRLTRNEAVEEFCRRGQNEDVR